jgi:hypothetical protein
VSLTWSGLEELKAALRALPADLAAEAGHLVQGAANGAAAEIKRGYPVRAPTPREPKSTASKPGDLRDGLSVAVVTMGPYGAGAVVRNKDKTASWFEYGTQTRRTGKGYGRGAIVRPSPPGRVFIPAVRAARRRLYADLADLVRRHGLTVSGRAE